MVIVHKYLRVSLDVQRLDPLDERAVILTGQSETQFHDFGPSVKRSIGEYLVLVDTLSIPKDNGARV